MSNTNKKSIALSVVTPVGEIFDGNVSQVVLPGVEGEFGVLSEHSSLITILSKGIITITHEDKTIENVVIDWGYCEVGDNKVYVLAHGALSLSKDSETSSKLKIANDLLDDSSSEYSSYASVGYLKQEISKSSH